VLVVVVDVVLNEAVVVDVTRVLLLEVLVEVLVALELVVLLVPGLVVVEVELVLVLVVATDKVVEMLVVPDEELDWVKVEDDVPVDEDVLVLVLPTGVVAELELELAPGVVEVVVLNVARLVEVEVPVATTDVVVVDEVPVFA
jgi:hypothetical protein